ncbi:type II secretion system protein [Candidatus Curtissbacteria bacterium]|nr:type II secretion system protein [Candidatus Curtissbacteria bacterium]
MSNLQFNKGFTLIELLIVITIIGILASLTLASFGGAQAKARDGVRKSDLSQVKRALELVKADCTGNAYYPNEGWGSGVSAYNSLGTYLSDPDLKYISSTPKDPKDSAPNQYGYATTTTTVDKCPDPSGNGTLTIDGGTDYSMWAVLERTSDADGLSSRTKCNGKPVPSGGTWTDAAYAGYYVICNN